MVGTDRKIHWRCFHCGETFTKAQERWAREHFGLDCSATPVCLMRVPGEGSLLTALRNAEADLSRYRAEDSDLMRALCAQSADHAVALRREEEKGYARGLNDGRARLVETHVYEFAGFKYLIYDEDGVPYASPLPGQHTDANQSSYRLGAVEKWLGV